MQYKKIIDFIRSLYPGRDFIALHEPYFAGNEKKYLLDCIDTTFVSSVGKYVDKFEEMVKEYTGTKYAIATVNGTSALHIALLLAGVKQDDYVLTQPLTFIATCNAISYCGAEPVFFDIDRKTLGMSADSLEKWLTENADVLKSDKGNEDSKYFAIHKESGRKIRACVPMHTFGHPCEIDRIVEICDRYHINVVEDSAESLGSYYKGQHTGTFGKLGILSFNGNKTITTGGGGMILTDDEQLGKLAKHITTTAKKPHRWEFNHDIVGYNYRLPNVNAAIGCAQMELLPEILKNKRETAMKYKSFFESMEEVEYVSESENSISNYWLNAVLLNSFEEREAFLELTNKEKVMTRPAWTLMNKLPMFNNTPTADLTMSNDIERRLVNIPSSGRF